MKKLIATLSAVVVLASGCLYGVAGDAYGNQQSCSGSGWLAVGWVRANTEGEQWYIKEFGQDWQYAEGGGGWKNDYEKVYFSKWQPYSNTSAAGNVRVRTSDGQDGGVYISAQRPC